MTIRIPNTSATPTKATAATKATPAAQTRTPDSLAAEGLATPSHALDTTTRLAMESRLGRSFSDVRIHSSDRAAATARLLGADAYTAGRSIVFNSGQYQPRSRTGERLLAHELAHVAHSRQATERRSGVAPENSAAERHAERTAAVAVGTPAAHSSQGFRDWGPAWAIHRQVDKISTKGTKVHSGEVGRAPGEIGVPIGTVEVRTGEEVEFKGGGKLPNVIALAYSGSLSADTHWLQFVWFEMTATIPTGIARMTGNISTTSGNKPFTTDPAAPNWSIDTTSATNPFYEAGGANLRDTSSTTMFDAPGGGSVAPLAAGIFNAGIGATAVTFTAHFETYLIQSNVAKYRVSYSASTAMTVSGGAVAAAAIGYSLGTTGQVTALPAARKTMLDTNFPAYKAIK